MDAVTSVPHARQAVAQYVRMSTEHQQYSTENQSLAILQYAQSRNMEIVRTYADHGKSGLSLTGRTGLQQLLQDVREGDVDFTAVLVYDVSRWGRFQNPDQGASYEYSLTTANILVHYCAEQFQNDGSLSSALLKTVKRGMAGEYSRELSVKVWAGQRRLIEMGFRQGGPAGYGLRRHLIDQDRVFKQVLMTGDRKSLQTDRVILVPGPDEEIKVVQEIYAMFLDQGRSQQEIATFLDSTGVICQPGRRWSRDVVHQILTNPKYIGTNMFNKRSWKLKQKRVKNPPDQWVFKDAAFVAIVEFDRFVKVQQIMDGRNIHLCDAEVLTRLRALLNRTGYLSGFVIDQAEGLPSAGRVASRFGSLVRAYTLVGWSPERDYRYIEINRSIRRQHADLIVSICASLEADGARVSLNDCTDLLTINAEYTASLVLARCMVSEAGNHGWLVRFDAALRPDITIAARLTPDNDAVLDYYLLPPIAELGSKVQLNQQNPLSLEVYRFDDLAFFTKLARRIRIEDAA